MKKIFLIHLMQITMIWAGTLCWGKSPSNLYTTEPSINKVQVNNLTFFTLSNAIHNYGPVRHLKGPSAINYLKNRAFLSDSNKVLRLMHKVADWQINHPSVEHDKLNWHYGAFYPGLIALYNITGEERYINYIKHIGEKHHWQLDNSVFNADHIAVGQSYLDIYMQNHNKKILENMKWVAGMYLKRRPKADVRFEGNPYYREWWSWCDALFMAPPFFAKMYQATHNIVYLNYMNKHWWLTSRYLYDSHDYLFYRDDHFFNKRTKGGQKIFWSRGNGWVMAGLARILQIMPVDYTSRQQYVVQFKEMARRIVGIQDKDGLWGPSLLALANTQMGESSGSAFFCYALAWGVNKGILSTDKYKKAALKAWNALVDNVNSAGRLGYVQAVGASPESVKKDQTEVYGSGAFLLAGSQIYKMLTTHRVSPK